MKSLLILRHGKSSWKHLELPDHDRPLNQRGKRDAPRMGKLLRDEKIIPEIMISSTAERARKTAEAVARASAYSGKIILKKSLYAAGPEAYIDAMHTISNKYSIAMIVGHNPAIEELVELLTGEPHLMPTCSLASIKLSIDKWLDVNNQSKGKLVDIWLPRDLR
jgi:phosphohistidine phosphatase